MASSGRTDQCVQRGILTSVLSCCNYSPEMHRFGGAGMGQTDRQTETDESQHLLALSDSFECIV